MKISSEKRKLFNTRQFKKYLLSRAVSGVALFSNNFSFLCRFLTSKIAQEKVATKRKERFEVLRWRHWRKQTENAIFVLASSPAGNAAVQCLRRKTLTTWLSAHENFSDVFPHFPLFLSLSRKQNVNSSLDLKQHFHRCQFSFCLCKFHIAWSFVDDDFQGSNFGASIELILFETN